MSNREHVSVCVCVSLCSYRSMNLERNLWTVVNRSQCWLSLGSRIADHVNQTDDIWTNPPQWQLCDLKSSWTPSLASFFLSCLNTTSSTSLEHNVLDVLWRYGYDTQLSLSISPRCNTNTDSPASAAIKTSPMEGWRRGRDLLVLQPHTCFASVLKSPY